MCGPMHFVQVLLPRSTYLASPLGHRGHRNPSVYLLHGPLQGATRRGEARYVQGLS
jgi:hypothetical protein